MGVQEHIHWAVSYQLHQVHGIPLAVRENKKTELGVTVYFNQSNRLPGGKSDFRSGRSNPSGEW